ncbi:hypothetical protein ACU4GD_07760 [Cupriavidus basilensis]
MSTRTCASPSCWPPTWAASGGRQRHLRPFCRPRARSVGRVWRAGGACGPGRCCCRWQGSGTWLVQLQVSLAGVVMAVTGSELAAMCARLRLAGLCVVFAPTMLLGAAFPAALRLCAEPGHIGRDVGVVLALNTIGRHRRHLPDRLRAGARR